ncbi:hypothetical protein SAMN05444360_1195 [Chryseobacterium carnipullorum]|nr:hypothetical protein SAMN05444360_1195 [Chryseobacterium carnipullorum]
MSGLKTSKKQSVQPQSQPQYEVADVLNKLGSKLEDLGLSADGVVINQYVCYFYLSYIHCIKFVNYLIRLNLQVKMEFYGQREV